MKTNLIKSFVIAFAVAAIGLMSAVPRIGAQEAVDPDVQAKADALYNTNEKVSNAYQKGFDAAEAQKRAAEEGEDEEEGGCCGGGA